MKVSRLVLDAKFCEFAGGGLLVWGSGSGSIRAWRKRHRVGQCRADHRFCLCDNSPEAAHASRFRHVERATSCRFPFSVSRVIWLRTRWFQRKSFFLDLALSLSSAGYDRRGATALTSIAEALVYRKHFGTFRDRSIIKCSLNFYGLRAAHSVVLVRRDRGIALSVGNICVYFQPFESQGAQPHCESAAASWVSFTSK